MNSARHFALIFPTLMGVFPSTALAQTAPAAPAAPTPAATPGKAPTAIPGTSPAAPATPPTTQPASAPGSVPAATTESAPTPHENPGQPIDARTAIQRAVANNPDFQNNRLSVAQADTDVRAEEGRYPYVFQADTQYTHQGGEDARTERSLNVGAELRRTFPYGTSASVRFDGTNANTFSRSRILPVQVDVDIDLNDPNSPQRRETQYRDFPYPANGYSSRATLQISQPLLRGAGRDVGEVGLRVAQQNRALSEKTQRRALSELTRDVLLAYYQLWLADESVRIDESALALAQRQEREADEQRQFGALAPADVYSFSSRVAQLEVTLVSARLDRRRQSFELNRLMGVAATRAPDVYAADAPVPGTSPTASEVESALRTDSLELAEAEAQVRIARTRAGVAGDSGRPRLDLTGSAQAAGTDQRLPTAFGEMARASEYTVQIGAVFELPLENTQRNAERESALLQVRIAEQNLKSTRDRLAADAASAIEQARSAEQRLALSQRSVEVAEKSHEAARARYELGGGIAIQVQQAEEDLRQARLSLARTRADLVAAQIAMRHLAGTLTKTEPG